MIKAKKWFGQNFLIDKSVISQIIQAIPKNSDNIVEIGPGLGDLTQELVKIAKTTAFEIDKELVEILKDKFADLIACDRFKLVACDVLDIWKDRNLSDKKYILVANLPYYIATNIILKALEDESCVAMIVMVQKEVAVKFCATPMQKEFSSLSILANLNSNSKILFDIGKEAFNPPPKVTSAVMMIEKFDQRFYEFDNSSYDEFKSFLKVAFSQPRKTLFKNLLNFYSKDIVSEIFDKLKISTLTRPHELNIAFFIKIYENLKAENGRKN
ncbi:MAG: 16S rRNA (adenine(1518)-N(6)/adenine(1519)-N(6))-dimethyltransferase RsmA [Campylobacter sp.]|nr:16S rRNA (adenine(1518)-N(6)/adenine(1519)-N(6))-dimethyltransferase RsmA [Campylobacter sp.]